MGVAMLRGTIQQIVAWIKRRCWKQLKKEAVAACMEQQFIIHGKRGIGGNLGRNM